MNTILLNITTTGVRPGVRGPQARGQTSAAAFFASGFVLIFRPVAFLKDEKSIRVYYWYVPIRGGLLW